MLKRCVRREWGWYFTLLDRKHFKVKLLYFRHAGKCSVQWHRLRNELWLFLKGDGLLNERPVMQGEWRLIEKRALHWYQAQIPTWILEIQYGDKCDETDIVRIP